MSGGSFNNASSKLPFDDCFSRDDHYSLLTVLQMYGLKAERIGEKLKEKIFELEEKEKEVRVEFERYEKLLRAVEYHQSLDYSEKEVIDELNKLCED